MKKSIVIIKSENGSNRSSIIRAISQILIGLSEKTVVNLGELGLSDNITSIVQIDNLRIGVASQNDISDNTLEMIAQLNEKSCDFILCAIRSDLNGSNLVADYATEQGFSILNLKSNWSEKLEVNYLMEEQVERIIDEIERVRLCLDN